MVPDRIFQYQKSFIYPADVQLYPYSLKAAKAYNPQALNLPYLLHR